MLGKKGLWILVGSVRARLRSQTSVFTVFGEGHSRLVETKWSVASVFAVKHIFFETFLFQEDLELPWPPQPRKLCFRSRAGVISFPLEGLPY